MIIKWKDRTNKNPNDCWCDALAYATKQSYEKVRDDLKCFIKADGAVSGDATHAYLYRHEFIEWLVEESMTVEECLHVYNNTLNDCVINLQDHVFYVKDMTIYDFEDQDHLKKKVKSLFLKRI